MSTARRALACGLTLAVAVPVAQASPVVIRDEMISDPAITPALGRGYSIATNTFQSICLAEIPKTKPSYNFIYSFEELDALAQDKPDVGVDAPGPSSGGGEVKLDVSGSATYQDAAGKRWYRHYLQVSIKIDVYYASIDEGKAKLGEAPTKLLTDKDIPGFFDACGVYYTRSLNRRSTYLSLFSYETETANRDGGFETALKNEITKFGPAAVAPQTQSPTPPPPTPPPAPATQSLAQQITNRKTTIRSFGFGLGKDQSAGLGEGLIAYDLKTFKDAVTVAFKSMQNDDVGIVTSIEVVPWVENPLFQATFALPPREVDDPAAAGKKLSISPYTQKRILSQNSEFLGEVDRSARARLINFYRARMCKSDIERNYAKRSNNRYDLGTNASRPLVNNRTGADPIPLSTLYNDELSDAKVKALQDEYDTFQYRTAQACLDQLLSDGFTTRVYRTMPACAGVETQLTVVSGRAIEDYCMPTFAKTGAGGTKP